MNERIVIKDSVTDACVVMSAGYEDREEVVWAKIFPDEMLQLLAWLTRAVERPGPTYTCTISRSQGLASILFYTDDENFYVTYIPRPEPVFIPKASVFKLIAKLAEKLGTAEEK